MSTWIDEHHSPTQVLIGPPKKKTWAPRDRMLRGFSSASLQHMANRWCLNINVSLCVCSLPFGFFLFRLHSEETLHAQLITLALNQCYHSNLRIFFDGLSAFFFTDILFCFTFLYSFPVQVKKKRTFFLCDIFSSTRNEVEEIH